MLEFGAPSSPTIRRDGTVGGDRVALVRHRAGRSDPGFDGFGAGGMLLWGRGENVVRVGTSPAV